MLRRDMVSRCRRGLGLYAIQETAVPLAEGASASPNFAPWQSRWAFQTTTRSGSFTACGRAAIEPVSTSGGSSPGAWLMCPCWRCASDYAALLHRGRCAAPPEACGGPDSFMEDRWKYSAIGGGVNW